MRKSLLLTAASIVLLAGCASRQQHNAPAPGPTPPPPPPPPPPMAPLAPLAPVAPVAPAAHTDPTTPTAVQAESGEKEIFPHVYFDAAAGLIAFDAEVPIDPGSKSTPVVYLETIACTRDTKEHE